MSPPTSPLLLPLLLFLSFARAHIALWDKGMYGLNFPLQSTDTQQMYNNNEPVNPLKEDAQLTVEQWFGHGHKGYPPKPGDYMELPAGGTYRGEVACNRALTKLRDPRKTEPFFEYACDGPGQQGPLHTMNKYFQQPDPAKFGGTALGIAYVSDVNALQPGDMTIISVNHNSVWEREISYQIPAGLPPCPPGGCICSWNWIHRAHGGEGYPWEIYNVLYKCMVTGATNSKNVVQKGQVARDCKDNKANCVKGPKTGLYLYQATGNNLPHLEIPPTYNSEWGFDDGAQNDIFAVVAPSPSPTPSPTAAPTPQSPAPPANTALPAGWTHNGCHYDEASPRVLPQRAYTGTANTIAGCIARAEAGGFKYAMVEYGEECWVGNTPVFRPAPAGECTMKCTGDARSVCGSPYRGNLYQKGASGGGASSSTTTTAGATTQSPTPSPSPSPSPTTTSPAGAGGNTPNGGGTTTPSPSPTPSPTPAALVAQTENLPGGWTYAGCFSEPRNARSLDGFNFTDYTMTAAVCLRRCQQEGFSYAGMQNKNQCFCGKLMPTLVTSGCVDPCAGDKTFACGGAYKNSVYSLTGPGTVTITIYPLTCPTTRQKRRLDWDWRGAPN